MTSSSQVFNSLQCPRLPRHRPLPPLRCYPLRRRRRLRLSAQPNLRRRDRLPGTLAGSNTQTSGNTTEIQMAPVALAGTLTCVGLPLTAVTVDFEDIEVLGSISRKIGGEIFYLEAVLFGGH